MTRARLKISNKEKGELLEEFCEAISVLRSL